MHRIRPIIGWLTGALCVVVALVTLCPTLGHATAFGLCDNDSPGLCTTSVTLSGTTLIIALTNTSLAANGGFLTAAAWNLPWNLPGNAQITAFHTTDAEFEAFPTLPSVGGAFNVQPFGQRGFLISAQGATFEGGGKPKGLAPGETATFTFTLNTAAGITENAENAVLTSEVLRFRGFANGASDKDQMIAQVSEPSSTVMLTTSLSLIGLLAYGRRRWQRAKSSDLKR
jgi:hypothetical protein